MVVGLTAVVIILIVAFLFWPYLDSAFRDFAWKVYYAFQGNLKGAKGEVK